MNTRVIEPVVLFSDDDAGRVCFSIGKNTSPRFVGFEDFRQSSINTDAFVIKSDNPDYVGSIIRAIRRDRRAATGLVVTHGQAHPQDHALTDGLLPGSSDQLLQRIHAFQERKRECGLLEGDQELESLLLQFMWLRPGYVLEPQLDWRHPRRYRYPIVEALDPGEAESEICLQRLEKQQFIERVDLKERQRECDFCGSAHLSFTDICPNCRSIDIDQHSALHCFTCGLIAPEERFVRGDLRVCPKCENRLRHIGSDYDRPLETHACRSCDHVFVEGEVVARCLICARLTPPEALRLRKIYSWKLGDLGRLAARGRRPQNAHAMFGPDRFATQEHFIYKLNWMLKLLQEWPDFSFCVLGLYLQNFEELRDSLGLDRTEILLDGFADRIKEQLADVDLAMRMTDGSIYLLIASTKRLAPLRKAIQAAMEQARQKDGTSPRWQLADMTTKGMREAAPPDADNLLEQLCQAANKRPAATRAA